MNRSPKEIESVIKLSAFDRYQHFIKRIADTEVLYSLCDRNGEFALSEVEGNKLIPFWPFEEYAELCKTSSWESYICTEINLSVFEQEITPIIQKEKFLLNIFPANEKTGFVVTLEEFLRDLSNELENY